MAKPTLKHQLPNGVIETRQSARPYTHVVVGEYDIDVRLAKAKREAEHEAKDHWPHWQRCVEIGPGSIYGLGYSFTVDQGMYDRAKQSLAQYGTQEAYRAAREAELVERVKARAESLQFAVLQWSQSRANAEKGANNERVAWGFKNIRVEPVNNGNR